MVVITTLDMDALRARQNYKWAVPADVIPSHPAEMDFDAAPAIQAAMQRLVDRREYGYTVRDETGPACMVADAFCRRMSDKFHWSDVDPARVVVLSDLIQAQIALIVAFSAEGEGVLIQTPAYPGFIYTIQDTGRRVVTNPLIDTGCRFEMDVAGLRAAIAPDTRIILLCLPQNPTGRVLSVEELSAVAELAVAHDLIVLSDEIHADLVFDGRVHVPFAKMFPEVSDRTVTLYSATKSFGIPGLGSAVMHFGSEALHDRFRRSVRPDLLGAPAAPGLRATLAAWEQSADWLASLVAGLEDRRDYMLAAFAEHLPTVRVYKPESTYFLWADFSACGLPDTPAKHLMARARVVVGEGGHFGADFADFARFVFATSTDIIDAKMARIAQAVLACR